MLIMALVVFLALTTAVLVLPGSPLRVRSEIHQVRPGQFAAMVRDLPAFDAALVPEASAPDAAAGSQDAPAPAAGRGEVGLATGRHSEQALDAAVPAVLAGLVGVHQWLHPDAQVLEAMRQATHHEVATSLDLWHEVRENHYHLQSESSLVNWRGHVGEHEVADQLHSWLGDRVRLEAVSNHPGSDLSIDGRDYNVKVTADYDNVGPEHLARYPDTPIILNADAANIPSGALSVDLSHPFDPAILDGHAVIVADGLSLSGIENSLGDSFGDVIGGHLDIGDLQDAGIPVLGSVIRVVRSGVRENRLRGVHGDSGRMVKNIATDVTVTGSTVATGVVAGHVIGATVDVLTGGATCGLGYAVGGMLGGALGGIYGNKAATSIRLQPFTDAREQARVVLAEYDAAVERVSTSTDRQWDAEVADASERCRLAEGRLRRSFAAPFTQARTRFLAHDLIGADGARRQLQAAQERVENAVRREHSVLARRRASAWRSAAAAAHDPEKIFDVILASPGGAAAVRTLLDQVRHQRELALATLAEATRVLALEALRVRAEQCASLQETKTRLQTEVKRQLQVPLAHLEGANNLVLAEARAAGLIDQS